VFEHRVLVGPPEPFAFVAWHRIARSGFMLTATENRCTTFFLPVL
jgi:hypothetical protein